MSKIKNSHMCYNADKSRVGSTFQSDGRCDYRKCVETHAKRSLSRESGLRDSSGDRILPTLQPKQAKLSADGRHVTVHKRAFRHYATAVIMPSLNFLAVV